MGGTKMMVDNDLNRIHFKNTRNPKCRSTHKYARVVNGPLVRCEHSQSTATNHIISQSSFSPQVYLAHNNEKRNEREKLKLITHMSKLLTTKYQVATELHRRSFHIRTLVIWDSLREHLRSTPSL